MEYLHVITNSLPETHELGRMIGKHASANMLILLDGVIGAGKTTLTQGIAQGMGVTRKVSSPTFTIQKIYSGRNMKLYHIDAYRLEGVEQDLGFEDDFEEGGLTVIEWSEFFPGLLPAEYLSVHIESLADERRMFTLEAHGTRYEAFLEELI